MKTKFRELTMRMLAAAGPTFRRFWVSVGFTVALTTTLIMSTTGPYPRPAEVLNRLSPALLAGILTSWCAVLFWEFWNRRLSAQTPSKQQSPAHMAIAGNLIALGAAGIVTGATYAMLKGLTFVAISRHVGICVFLFLMFFIIPHIRKNQGLEMYIVRLFTQAVVSVLFAAVMFFGLSAITFTVTYLFSIDVSYRIYLQIWLVMVGVLAPFLFMAGVPAAGATVESDDYPKVLYNLVVYVVTPLLTTYTVILYLYFAKILITRQWPVGLVSHLVLWYSVASTAMLYFVWPLTSGNKWAETFSRYFKKTVIPLLAMMFFSIGIRIKFYGITENRYYVLVLGLWVLGSMLYLNLAKARKTVVLPVSLAIVVALSVIGPWSSFAVSKWSQNRRLERLCDQYGMADSGTISPSSQVAQSDRREMAAILQYFDRYHDLADVKLLPQGFTLAQFEQVFGFSYADTELPVPVQGLQYEAAYLPMDISEYQYLFDYTRPQYKEGNKISLSQGGVVTTYDGNTQSIAVSLNGGLEWEKSLAEFIDDLLPQYEPQYEPQNRIEFRREDMAIEAETANLRIKVVITILLGEVEPASQKPVIHHVGFFVLVGGTGE